MFFFKSCPEHGPLLINTSGWFPEQGIFFVTTVQLSTSVHLILIQYLELVYHLNSSFVCWSNNVIYGIFPPVAVAAWKENIFESNEIEFIISKNTNFPLI